MPNRSGDRIGLLDAESVEAEIIDHEYSLPPSAPPPSYEFATGSSSNPYQISTQPVPPLFYGYTHVKTAEGQFLIPGNAPAQSGGQPIFVIPVTVQPVASGQPLVVHQYENQNSNRGRSSDPDDEDKSCENCCIACICCLEMMKCTVQCLALMAACSKN